MKTLVILTALCFVLAGISFAGNVTITEVVTGGNLTLTMPSAFSLSGVTIGGSSVQNATGNATYTVEDSRGSGAGWSLGVQIGQFVTAGTPVRTIATNKFFMSLQDSDITTIYGQTKDNFSGRGPLSKILGSNAVAGTEVEMIEANTDYGMGKYTAQATHTLYIDADRYVGTYTATITATLNATP